MWLVSFPHSWSSSNSWSTGSFSASPSLSKASRVRRYLSALLTLSAANCLRKACARVLACWPKTKDFLILRLWLKILIALRILSKASWACPSRRMYSIFARSPKPYADRNVSLKDEGSCKSSFSGVVGLTELMSGWSDGKRRNWVVRNLTRSFWSFERADTRANVSGALGVVLVAVLESFMIADLVAQAVSCNLNRKFNQPHTDHVPDEEHHLWVV